MRNGEACRLSNYARNPCQFRGFTLVELLVVLAILALLLSLAVPRYFMSVDRAKEQALKQQLTTTRKALDEYYADTGQYPETLQDLVDHHYLDKMPWDPIAETSENWVIVPPELPLTGGVYNLHSSDPGQSQNGTPYAEW